MSDIDFRGKFFVEQIRDGKVIDKWEADNAVTIEGRRSLLSQGLLGGAQKTSWYIGIYSGSIAPDENFAGATVSSASTEISTKYDEATREVWTGALHATAGSVTNSASVATFTFNAGETVRGAFLIDVSTKGGGGDAGATLMAIANFAARTVASTDLLNITYELSTSTV